MTTRQTQAIMRKSLITIGLAAASLAAIAGLTGCGTASHSAPVAATATGITANDVANQIGAGGFYPGDNVIGTAMPLNDLGVTGYGSAGYHGHQVEIVTFDNSSDAKRWTTEAGATYFIETTGPQYTVLSVTGS
jgi:hypothetical protein